MLVAPPPTSLTRTISYIFPSPHPGPGAQGGGGLLNRVLEWEKKTTPAGAGGRGIRRGWT